VRSLYCSIIVLLGFLQFQIWFGAGGLPTLWQLKANIVQQAEQNRLAMQRNQVLLEDIKDLRKGDQAVEERARNELGMIKQDETFYQVGRHR